MKGFKEMRKMPYAIIFIVLLAILVFAGCKALSGDKNTTEPDQTAEVTTEEPSETNALDPILNGIEDLTGEDGETLLSSDDVSSLYEELSSLAAEESASAAQPETTQPAAPASEPASTPADTTAAPAPDETTTAAVAPETTTAAPLKPTSNEYDILRSGHFYLDGSMYSDGKNNPVTLAISDDVVYMQATMDGMTMGLLRANKKTYMLNPPTKTYCEFGSVFSGVLQKAGLMSEDEIKDFIDSMGFSTMQDLDEADSVTTGTVGSTECDVYIFNKDDGTKTRVYLNNGHLKAFEVLGTDGAVASATYITTLTSEIPPLPPEDYTKQSAVSFIMSMEEMMGD